MKNNLPGFVAEASLYTRSDRSQGVSRESSPAASNAIVPQFIGRGIICAGLVAAIIAGQEEFLPLAISYCGSGSA
jgi:hypothetical protein